MAPNLSQFQHAQIRDMILNNCSIKDIANAVDYNPRAIYRIKKNLRCYGSTEAPSNGAGRPRSLTSAMIDALRELLKEKPGTYQYEMVEFLWDKFRTRVTTSSVRRCQIN